MSIEGTSQSPETQETTAATDQTSGKGGGNPPTYSAVTSVGTLKMLKEVAPDVYKKTLEMMATQFNQESQKHTEKLKKIRQEYERR